MERKNFKSENWSEGYNSLQRQEQEESDRWLVRTANRLGAWDLATLKEMELCSSWELPSETGSFSAVLGKGSSEGLVGWVVTRLRQMEFEIRLLFFKCRHIKIHAKGLIAEEKEQWWMICEALIQNLEEWSLCKSDTMHTAVTTILGHCHENATSPWGWGMWTCLAHSAFSSPSLNNYIFITCSIFLKQIKLDQFDA